MRSLALHWLFALGCSLCAGQRVVLDAKVVAQVVARGEAKVVPKVIAEPLPRLLLSEERCTRSLAFDLLFTLGWSLCAEQLVARVVAKSVARVVPEVVAVRGKMHAQFWVSCSDGGGRFARGSVLPRLLSSRLLPGMLPRLLPFRCQGLC